MSNRTRLIAGAFVAAAVRRSARMPSAVSTRQPAGRRAQPACLAWFGNKEDGKCLSYSNGQRV